MRNHQWICITDALKSHGLALFLKHKPAYSSLGECLAPYILYFSPCSSDLFEDVQLYNCSYICNGMHGKALNKASYRRCLMMPVSCPSDFSEDEAAV